jgi:hypothetical protein
MPSEQEMQRHEDYWTKGEYWTKDLMSGHFGEVGE